MQAKKVIMVANGEGKAEIICRSFAGPVTTDVPCSVLQKHENIILVGDSAALHLLKETDRRKDWATWKALL
jgi:glucosamine-6-phosphate deaminase